MSIQPQDLHLAARAVHSIADVHGLQLRCNEGTLWLTLDHDPRDVILEAGESFTGTEHRRGVVYALADAQLSMTRNAAVAKQTPTRLGRVAQHA